jgi:hypothetical protein
MTDTLQSGAESAPITIVTDVLDLFRASGFEVREDAGFCAVTGSVDAAGVLVDSVLEYCDALARRATAAPSQNIDTPEFHELLAEWANYDDAATAYSCEQYKRIVAYIDARRATAPHAASKRAESDNRYRFLLSFLLERGVLNRYDNGVWRLRGIYGVDDSGLKGAGRTPEEALDNAIVAVNLDPVAADKFWRSSCEAVLAQPETGAAAALRKLCDQLEGMKRRMRHTPGTGQNHSYLLHEDVEAYVEEARKVLDAHPAESAVPAVGSALVAVKDEQQHGHVLPPVAAPVSQREALITATVNCGHSIDENKIVLHRDKRKDGNALSQLADRLEAAVASRGRNG